MKLKTARFSAEGLQKHDDAIRLETLGELRKNIGKARHNKPIGDYENGYRDAIELALLYVDAAILSTETGRKES